MLRWRHNDRPNWEPGISNQQRATRNQQLLMIAQTLAAQRHFQLSRRQFLGGVDQKLAEPGPDGAGDHARGNGVFLTGVRLKKSATDLRAGVSIDQLLARQIGHLTRFPSLELSSDAIRTSGSCDSNYACA